MKSCEKAKKEMSGKRVVRALFYYCVFENGDGAERKRRENAGKRDEGGSVVERENCNEPPKLRVKL